MVNYGDSLRFTITPNAGYFVSDVHVDSVSVGSVTGYTFMNVTQAHTIQAFFGLQTFKITSTAGAGGTISPLGSAVVNYGDSLQFTITPNAGYFIASVHVDTASLGPVSNYTFHNVQANHTISATFAINTYTITATAGTGGSISPSGSQTVNYGADPTFTITADPGYAVSDVLVDSVSQGAVTSYQFIDVAAEHTISASFASQ